MKIGVMISCAHGKGPQQVTNLRVFPNVRPVRGDLMFFSGRHSAKPILLDYHGDDEPMILTELESELFSLAPDETAYRPRSVRDWLSDMIRNPKDKQRLEAYLESEHVDVELRENHWSMDFDELYPRIWENIVQSNALYRYSSRMYSAKVTESDLGLSFDVAVDKDYGRLADNTLITILNRMMVKLTTKATKIPFLVIMNPDTKEVYLGGVGLDVKASTLNYMGTQVPYASGDAWLDYLMTDPELVLDFVSCYEFAAYEAGVTVDIDMESPKLRETLGAILKSLTTLKEEVQYV